VMGSFEFNPRSAKATHSPVKTPKINVATRKKRIGIPKPTKVHRMLGTEKSRLLKNAFTPFSCSYRILNQPDDALL